MPNSPIVGNGRDTSSARRFGTFELDLRAGELRRNGIRVKLQEQPFQVLAELVERPGQVVTREQLRNRLWPGNTYVDFDHSLNAAIRRLRDALGDAAENPTFVETVARRGYRFLAPVSGVPQEGSGLTEAEAESLPPSEPTSKPRFRHGWVAALVSAGGLIVVGLAIGFAIAPRSPVLNRTTRLTANPEGDPIHAAAISRDGRYLAFSDQTGFYLRQISSGETHPIALPAGMSVASISWSPDIDHMVVGLAATNHLTSLWEVSILGGNARKLVEEGSRASISPNGKQMAFLVGQPLHQRIWLAGMYGEPPHELLGEDGNFFGSISWSPDGRKIAYTSARFMYGYGTKAMIAVADVGDSSRGRGRPTTVLSLAGLEAAMVWAADGRLIYTVDEPRPRQEDSNLWSIRLNSQTKPQGAPLRLTNDEGSVFTVSASADGSRIVYGKGVPQPDVYVAKLLASGNLKEEPQRLTLDDRRDLPYDWTADNQAVIFASDRTGTFCLYKQRIDQTMPEMLVSASQQVMGPRLTPDGTHILYMLNPHWGDPNFEVPLMSVPLAGGPARELAKARWITNVQCARAPATVCVYSVLSDSGLTFFRFDSSQGGGSQFLQIKDELGQAYNWSLSPVGTTLAIAKGKWGNDEPRIRLVSLDGAPDRWLAIHGWPAIRSIDWAADGKSLWATTAGETENVLLGIDLQGNARAVWNPKNVSVGWAIPSRDGKLLALHVRSSSANAWMLEH